MNILFKILAIVLAFSLGKDVLAQSFGIRGGLNLSNMTVENDIASVNDDLEMNLGYHVGVSAELPLVSFLSLETGVFLTTKGFKISQEESFLGSNFEGELNLLYLDIPLTAKASLDLGNVKVYGVFGPYFGIGLDGKFETEVSLFGLKNTTEMDVKWSDGNDFDEDEDVYLKRFDYGLVFGAGVEISSFQIGVNYSLGLANVSGISILDEDGIYHRVIGIYVGYNFGGK
jgi:hypothetical protein